MMSKTLIIISKLIPKLGTDNEHEKLTTLSAIERLLRKENISWTDVGLQLNAFLVDTLGFVEEEKLSPPKEEATAKPSGWTTQSPTGRGGSGGRGGRGGANGIWQTAAPNPPPQPPTPPPRPVGRNWHLDVFSNTWVRVIDSRIASGTKQDKLDLCAEMLATGPKAPTPVWTAEKERQFILTVQIMWMSDLTPTAKQLREFSEMSKKL